jgi:ABC-type branched-subunit amino acid transport system ATPase component
MSPEERRVTARLLSSIREREDLTMLRVEHDLDFVRGLCDIVTVLHNGRGEDVKRSTPGQMMRLGIGYVAQEGNVFAGLSVADNLRVGGLVAGAKGVEVERVLDLFPALCERMRQDTASPSGGTKDAGDRPRCFDVRTFCCLTS